MDTITQPPYFTIARAGLTRKKFRVRLVGANGEIIAVTQMYTTPGAAYDACHLINSTYAIDPNFTA